MSQGSERPRSVHTAVGGIVLDIRSGRMFSLNTTGSMIFQLLEQGCPEHRIVERLVRCFDIPTEVAKADLAQFCESLTGHALLAGCDGPASD